MSPILKMCEALLDAIIPLRDRSARTKSRSLNDIPLIPTSHELLRSSITTLMDYRQSEVQDLIRSLKYDRSAAAATLAASVLTDYLREEISSQKQFSARKILIVSVPLHKNRENERRYNQIALVLERLPREFRGGEIARLAPEILMRSRETKPQTRLHRSERLSNVAGAFALAEGAAVNDCHVFLIDDVTTTGATLVNAATPLKKAGATVTLLALARA